MRKWRAGHNHMALVCVARLSLIKERRRHLPYAGLLSCTDLVDRLGAQLPVKIRVPKMTSYQPSPSFMRDDKAPVTAPIEDSLKIQVHPHASSNLSRQ